MNGIKKKEEGQPKAGEEPVLFIGIIENENITGDNIVIQMPDWQSAI